MATRQTTPEPEAEAPVPAPNGDASLGDFGGDLGKLLQQAQRPQRWFISNPSEDTNVPEGAFIQRGYPINIAGQVVAIERVPSQHGPMPVYILDIGRGADFPLVRFGLTATLLRNAHERHQVQVGDTIAATCPGKRQGKEQEYEDWTMLVQKGDGTIPAAGIGPSGDDESF